MAISAAWSLAWKEFTTEEIFDPHYTEDVKKTIFLQSLQIFIVDGNLEEICLFIAKSWGIIL